MVARAGSSVRPAASVKIFVPLLKSPLSKAWTASSLACWDTAAIGATVRGVTAIREVREQVTCVTATVVSNRQTNTLAVL